ncbi:LysR family transcriptional regulator [Comamonas piscis]|uniref:LysR family transcriptional regulator n=1 Tax=Comamonas piscis TaxID=1562974 RepID=A0A7G5EKI4_9BURK|nr:TOBE domain-containing protein [Comamonas piscis]QMV74509.1 LysR family transcriptional regulator [Comamonas piscis]WSO32966.1 TOBE domain-containing protein [Comamonas piscis]
MIPQASLAAALAEKRSDRRIDVLRHIQNCGSISEAARRVGVSYKAAWQALDTLSNLAGVELVQRSVGGKGGGGAQLTADALLLLEAADAMGHAREQLHVQLEHARQLPAAADSQARAAGAAGISVATTLARLQVMTSMRNQWPCVVAQLSRRGPLVQVQLQGADAGAQFVLHSHITDESVQLLGLRRGLPVLAMCKATAVTVQAASAAADVAAGSNGWQGVITRATRGGAVQELAVRLSSGMQLVGFSRETSSLRVRAAVQVTVEPSAVVIALSGE